MVVVNSEGSTKESTIEGQEAGATGAKEGMAGRTRRSSSMSLGKTNDEAASSSSPADATSSVAAQLAMPEAAGDPANKLDADCKGWPGDATTNDADGDTSEVPRFKA
jgi:hypothetical protein